MMNPMKTFVLLTLLSSILLTGLLAQPGAPMRPKITGVAHIALAVHDIDQARVFYKDFLGFGEPFKLDNPDGSLSLTFIKVNDRQYIELFPGKEPNTYHLPHIPIQLTPPTPTPPF